MPTFLKEGGFRVIGQRPAGWVPGEGFHALGGPGSGNFGHSGRPGEVGGSGGGGLTDQDIQYLRAWTDRSDTFMMINDPTDENTPDAPAFVETVNKLALHDGPAWRGTSLEEMQQVDPNFKLEKGATFRSKRLLSASSSREEGARWARVQPGDKILLEYPARATRSLPRDVKVTEYDFEQEVIAPLATMRVKSMSRDRAGYWKVRLTPVAVKTNSFRTLGGPGSGNFGHEGRPGEVGGSGGGSASESSGGRSVTVEIYFIGGKRDYVLSSKASALARDNDWVWEHDLLPSLDGQRMAGISDSDNATARGAAGRINALTKKHGLSSVGYAVDVRSEMGHGRVVGVATVRRNALQEKDYPDFLKATADYFAGHGLSDRQERILGKWLGFPKKSTDAFLARKHKWGARENASFRTLGGPGSGNFGHQGRPGEVGGSGGGANLSESMSRAIAKAVNHPKEDGELLLAVMEDGRTLEALGPAAGLESSVGFGKDDQRTFDNNPVAMIVHTHPEAVGFSVQDVRNFVSQENVRSMVVVDSDGNQYRLDRADTFDRRAGGKLLERIADNVFELSSARKSTGPLSAADRARLYAKAVDAALLSQPGIKYSRIDPTPPRTLGGPGSGNFGHEGRPGEVGGSGGGGDGGLSTPAEDQIFEKYERTMKIAQVGSDAVVGLDGALWKMTETKAGSFQLADAGHWVRMNGFGAIRATECARIVRRIVNEAVGQGAASYVLTSSVFGRGRAEGRGVAVDDLPAFRQIVEQHKQRYDQMERQARRDRDEGLMKGNSSFRLLGGPGSGNFGHSGRPGEVGGSADDGGAPGVPTYKGVELSIYRRQTGTEVVTKKIKGEIKQVEVPTFEFVDARTGAAVDKATSDRIRAMIPGAMSPAAVAVYVNPNFTEDGFLGQVHSKDGRTVRPVYSEEHWDAANKEKFARVRDFARSLDDMRQRIDSDANAGRPEAIAARIMDETLIRVGGGGVSVDRERLSKTGEKRDVPTYGLTGLRPKHFTVTGDEVRMRFHGKSGKRWDVTVEDGRVARFVRTRLKSADPREPVLGITAGRFNEYMNELSGGRFTAKDFRTHHCTAAAAEYLSRQRLPRTMSEKRWRAVVRDTAKFASRVINDEPGTALKNYIDPVVWSTVRRSASMKANAAEYGESRDDILRRMLDSVIVVDVKGQPVELTNIGPAVVDDGDDDAPSRDKRYRTLGGPGSGNFGHAGRPGEVGGSGEGGVKLTKSDLAALDNHNIYGGAGRPEVVEELSNAAKQVVSKFSGNKMIHGVLVGTAVHLVPEIKDKNGNPSPNVGQYEQYDWIPRDDGVIHGAIEVTSRGQVVSDRPPRVGRFSWVVDYSTQGTYRHEVGHAVHTNLPHGLSRQWEEACKGPNLSGFDRNVSQYAATNEQEMFAESFSAYTSPLYQRGSLPSRIESFMDTLHAETKRGLK